jgi:DNA-binding transcriptional regulator YiaG
VRVKYMMETLNITKQTEFGNLCGASRALVNHWVTGRTKLIDPTFALLRPSTELPRLWSTCANSL